MDRQSPAMNRPTTAKALSNVGDAKSSSEAKSSNNESRPLPPVLSAVTRSSSKSEAISRGVVMMGGDENAAPRRSAGAAPAASRPSVDVSPISPASSTDSSSGTMTPSQRASQRRSISKRNFVEMLPSPAAAAAAVVADEADNHLTPTPPLARPRHMRNRSRSESSLFTSRKHALSQVSKEKGLPSVPPPADGLPGGAPVRSSSSSMVSNTAATPPARYSGAELATNTPPFDPNFGLKSLRASKGMFRTSEEIKVQMPVLVTSSSPTEDRPPRRSVSNTNLRSSDLDSKEEEVIDLSSDIPVYANERKKQPDDQQQHEQNYARKAMTEAPRRKAESPAPRPQGLRSLFDAPQKKLPAAGGAADSDELPRDSPSRGRSATEAPVKKLPKVPPAASGVQGDSPVRRNRRSLFEAPEKSLPDPAATRSRSLTNRRVKDQ
eukprot:TRINITY_DN17575_c0_g1_i1.p1 TRINITY_DN17575_c0_g1~~TRINITY_DN17575_c0_g1_i1.p1  ORF type:complete len:436 (-),score=112.75 TRINITY_DN17575_c0_g1_i1:124-1431(-)